MAITISCCLKPIPPTSNSSTFPPPNRKSAWFRDEKWRGQCVLGMACLVIGHEMGNFADGDQQNVAMAKEVVAVESQQRQKVLRWSDKRRCPPWHDNSLETIVPENLPRPSAPRRWEAVGYSKIAPPVIFRSSNTCFSM